MTFPNQQKMNSTQDGFYQSSYGPVHNATGNVGMDGRGNNPEQQQYYVPPASFEEEPPLLEELGINIPAVITKAKAVANPFSRIDSTFADEADMTGPVVFYLMLAFLLLLQGKIQFGVIYGQATVGCLTAYFVFNLMSNRGIDLYRSTSVLGYSMLPMVLLSLIIPVLRNLLVAKIVLAGACIFWSSTTATKIFVAVLAMNGQFWLVWYPLALLYTSFAFITVF